MRASPPSLLTALTGRPGASAAVLLATTVLGVVLPLARDQAPTARATLLLREPITAEDLGDTDGRAYVRSQAAVARLPLVAILTAAATDAVHPTAGVDLRAVQEGLRITLASGETGLVFRMRHPDPEVAQYAADAAAYSYQRIRRGRLRAEAAADITRLDAVERSLRALPPGTRQDLAREAVARQRALAAVQQSEPDLGIVAAVPAELDERVVRRPVAAGSGLLAGLVPALALGHHLQVRDARRAARGLTAGAPVLPPVRVRRGQDQGLLAALLPQARGTVVALVAADVRECAEVTDRLASAARTLGREVVVLDPLAPSAADRAGTDLTLVPMTRAAAGRRLLALRSADCAIVVTPAGRRRPAALAAAREVLAAVRVPVLTELVVARRIRGVRGTA